MLVIDCPHCGPRNSSEFAYSGERTGRPDPSTTTPEEWRWYLYGHENTADFGIDRWFHGSGCRKFLDVERHSVTNEIRSVELAGGDV